MEFGLREVSRLQERLYLEMEIFMKEELIIRKSMEKENRLITK